MDQDIGSETPADPAAAAFDALRREVALLNVALAGLAAERARGPDYSETLAEISQGLSIVITRTGKMAASPALALGPGDIARQITTAGDEARRQDHAAWRQAQEALQRATADLSGWVETARLASVQNWRLLQAALLGLVGGAILAASLINGFDQDTAFSPPATEAARDSPPEARPADPPAARRRP